MIDSLLRMIGRVPGHPSRGRARLAAAGLLAEAARTGVLDETAQAALVLAIRTRFGLSGPAAAALAGIAEGEKPDGYDPGALALAFSANATPDERREVMRLIWRTAWNDEGLKPAAGALAAAVAPRLGLSPEEAAAARAA